MKSKMVFHIKKGTHENHNNTVTLSKIMKKFNLKKSLNGSTTRTKSGFLVNALTLFKDPNVIVGELNGEIYKWTLKGKGDVDYPSLDLVTEQNIGWINLYEDAAAKHLTGQGLKVTRLVHPTKKSAHHERNPNHIATVKVKW